MIWKNQIKKNMVILAIVLGVAYMGYRIIEFKTEMAVLQEKAIESDTLTVSITYPRPLPSKETIQLPGTIQAWFQAPIYA